MCVKTAREEKCTKRWQRMAKHIGHYLTLHGKDVASTQMVANIAEILEDSFASLSQSMSEGFDNLGQMFQGSCSACMSQESRLIHRRPHLCWLRCVRSWGTSSKETKKQWSRSKHWAAIISKLLKEKTKEDKLTEIKKPYLAPKNCDRLAETRVNLPIWNNLSEKAHRADIKLQKVEKSLVKRTTAVVSVVNNLITAPWIPQKMKL